MINVLRDYIADTLLWWAFLVTPKEQDKIRLARFLEADGKIKLQRYKAEQREFERRNLL